MTAHASPNAPASPRPAAAGGSGVEEAPPREVAEWLRAGSAVLVDVREPDEHAREHITGSRLMPLSTFDPSEAASHAGGAERLVLHCRGGRRSADAARLVSGVGPGAPRVVSMAGGIEAWKAQGLPVEINTRVSRVSVMRQVQLVIGAGVLAGSALAWLVHPWFIAVPAFFGAGLTFAGATGTCALATLLGAMPWNRAGSAGAACSVSGRSAR